LRSAFPVEGDTDAASTAAPPTELLLMMLTPLVGGTPLPVPKICAAAAGARPGGTPAAGVAPKL